MAKTKKRKVIPGVTNRLHGGRPQVQRPKHPLPESSDRIGFATSGITSSINGASAPYVKPGVTKKPTPSLTRVPVFKNGVMVGLRKVTRKTR